MKALLDRRTDPTWMLYAAIIAWLAGLLRSLTGRPPAPRPAVPRRSGVRLSPVKYRAFVANIARRGLRKRFTRSLSRKPCQKS
ncbi:MAG: hypothetical protein KH101_26690 [Pseudomonas aeruginosa]|nr:hypothetical protein [Pseudomonas aeruginosa]